MSEGILHREPAIINREYQHCERITEPRPAWWEGEQGAVRLAIRRVRRLQPGEEATINNYIVTRTSYTNYRVQRLLADAINVHTIDDVIKVLNGEYIKPQSQYTGVTFVTRVNRKHKWVASIYHEKQRGLGHYDNEIDAARAYDRYVIEHGLDRPLNFPPAQEDAA